MWIARAHVREVRIARMVADLSIDVVGLLRRAQLVVPSGTTADEILSALDLGDPAARLTTNLGPRSRARRRSLLWLVAFVPAALCFASRAPAGLVLLLFLAAWGLTTMAGINQLANATLTRSGLWLQRVFSKPTFVPFTSVARADSVGEQSVLLVLRDGTKIDLFIGPDELHLGALVFGAIGAISSRETFVAAVEDGIRLAETSHARCIDDLMPTTPFRSAAVPTDQLWKIVEDVAAPIAVRIQAATVLRGTDEGAPERLRVAGDVSGSEPVRIALARIAEHPAIQQASENEDGELVGEGIAIEDEAPPRVHRRA